jgi:adenine/guanine phosphoribosyltransferase-like PRPP-binding protein
MATKHKCVSYLENALNPAKRDKTIKRMVSYLKEHDKIKPFDSIAVCGVSGLLMGVTVADKLNKSIIVVRKGDDTCHSAYCVEGAITDKYVIVDDCIATGKTIKNTIVVINAHHNKAAKCVGIILYELPRLSEHLNYLLLNKREQKLIIETGKWNIKRKIDWRIK